MSPRVAWQASLAALVLALALPVGANEIARGDAAWERRAEGQVEGRAQPGPIADAARAYEAALVADPDDLEARWKLLRALHFAGDFASESAAQRDRSLDRAREVTREGFERLAARLELETLDGLDPTALEGKVEEAGLPTAEVARLHFWSAINWGAWSRDAGLMRAVREGVANRLYRYAGVSLELEPEVEGGGALRLLGRLHAELPRVPFITGWVDRKQALPLLERALAIEPEHPGNRLLFALSLIELAPDRRGEAQALLRGVAGLTPHDAMQVEELAIRNEARRALADAIAAN